ncbi:hypothetical protein JCM16303_001078 [Sporobolomyces ruberrimus]
MSGAPPLAVEDGGEAAVTSPALRSSFLSKRIFSPLVSKNPLRPDAPWVAFIRARNDLLDAYHALYASDRAGKLSLIDHEVRRAFVRFSLALDSVSTPHEWWSELPREAFEAEVTHAKLLGILVNLAASVRSLTAHRKEVSRMRTVASELDEGLRWLQEQKRLACAKDPRSRLATTDAWPFDGSYPNTPIGSPPLFASDSGGSSVRSFSSCSTIGKRSSDNIDRDDTSD